MNKTDSAARVLSLMDLTSLNNADTNANIVALCHSAVTAAGTPAAVCIYAGFVPLAKATLSELGVAEQIRVATVTNFPDGGNDIALAVQQTQAAIADGADEVDLVFPWRALMAGDEHIGLAMVKACKAACGERLLKVIIESGELAEPVLIQRASELAIEGGADFIKTSTGKVVVNATLDAAEVMLKVIRDKGGHTGFKAAGGVRTLEQAEAYLALAARIMGPEWATPARFRFGASGLLHDLLKVLQLPEQQANKTPGY